VDIVVCPEEFGAGCNPPRPIAVVALLASRSIHALCGSSLAFCCGFNDSMIAGESDGIRDAISENACIEP
jgi:hypothetical protein